MTRPPCTPVKSLLCPHERLASLRPQSAPAIPHTFIEIQGTAMSSIILLTTSPSLFYDSRQQLAVSACRPLGGVVSSLSLHPAGQSAQNRILGRRGHEQLLMPDGNTFAPRGQQQIGFSLKGGHRQSLFLMMALIVQVTIFIRLQLSLILSVLIHICFQVPSLNRYMRAIWHGVTNQGQQLLWMRQSCILLLG